MPHPTCSPRCAAGYFETTSMASFSIDKFTIIVQTVQSGTGRRWRISVNSIESQIEESTNKPFADLAESPEMVIVSDLLS